MPKSRAEYMREWRSRHPENVEYQRAYDRAYRADPDKQEQARARAKAWRAANPERFKLAKRRCYDRLPKVGRPTGERHANWKGDRAGYGALHHWLYRQLGKPRLCDHCGTTTAKQFEWSNKDHKYRRSLDDWQRLCASCHRRYDIKQGLCLPPGRKPAQ